MFNKIRNRILLLNMIMISVVTLAAFATGFLITYQQVMQENRNKLSNESMHLGGFAFVQFLGMSDVVVTDLWRPHIEVPGTQRQLSRSIIHDELFNGIMITESRAEFYELRIIVGDTQGEWIRTAHLISPGAGVSFSLLVDGEGNIIEGSSFIEMSIEDYEKAAVSALKSSGRNATVIINDRIWQHMIQPASISFGFADMSGRARMEIGEFRIIHFLDVTDSHQMLRTLFMTLSGLALVILAFFYLISRYFANRAIKPMQSAWDKQNRFIADASHELKTPLSVIQANCGVLYANSDETVQSQLKWVDHIANGSNRMSGLINNLLELSYVGDTKLAITKAPFNISETVIQAVETIEAIAQDKNIQINMLIEPDVEIISDKERVRQVLDILIDNAGKYTNIGGKIDISLKRTKKFIEFAIRNTGIGISDEDISKLFDRFYRADASRGAETGGYGLGLSIAKAVSDLINAKISVSGKQGEFTEFSVRF